MHIKLYSEFVTLNCWKATCLLIARCFENLSDLKTGRAHCHKYVTAKAFGFLSAGERHNNGTRSVFLGLLISEQCEENILIYMPLKGVQ